MRKNPKVRTGGSESSGIINDLLNNQHANYYLQQDFNKFGKAFFKFEVLQEVERDSITITQSKLLMLENAYIEKYKNEDYEENYDLEDVLDDTDEE